MCQTERSTPIAKGGTAASSPGPSDAHAPSAHLLNAQAEGYVLDTDAP
jgi:hypothetical protein